MKSDNRIYHYVGQITLNKECTLKPQRLPEDDLDPWLFLVMDKKGKSRFTFFYKIENAQEFSSKKSFNLQMSFIMGEAVKRIRLGEIYDVWKGEKNIGQIKIIAYFNESR